MIIVSKMVTVINALCFFYYLNYISNIRYKNKCFKFYRETCMIYLMNHDLFNIHVEWFSRKMVGHSNYAIICSQMADLFLTVNAH